VSPYDGLNLTDLLALMHDIVVPEPVAWLPGTSGWWILLGWLLAVLLLIGWALGRHRRRNRYRREALAELKAIDRQPQRDAAEVAQQVSVLLRRTALAAYSREQVAAIYGAEWAQFLKRTANNDATIADAADSLATASYRSDVDGKKLIAPARRWIRLHRA
jgi:hypothetical protein